MRWITGLEKPGPWSAVNARKGLEPIPGGLSKAVQSESVQAGLIERRATV
jgi:hypothetical protein